MDTLSIIFLLATGLVAIYLLWRFYGRYQKEKGLYDIYYMLGFAVLLVSGLLLIFLSYDILPNPLVLTVASLIPLGISLGIANQFYPQWKKAYAWFALIGFLAIAVSSIAELELLRKISVPVFHGVAGFVIFLGPFFAKDAAKGFWWVGVGGALIGLGGIALAFLVSGSQFLFFSMDFVLTILAPLLFLMSLCFAWGFTKDIQASGGD
jgi:hypothetical protein